SQRSRRVDQSRRQCAEPVVASQLLRVIRDLAEGASHRLDLLSEFGQLFAFFLLILSLPLLFLLARWVWAVLVYDRRIRSQFARWVWAVLVQDRRIRSQIAGDPGLAAAGVALACRPSNPIIEQSLFEKRINLVDVRPVPRDVRRCAAID
ncbi:MAG TPA: hypothetical protein PKC18_17205, partial [Lacipirellulaceae bacterium]|nr:hypothetical protein [Lacipirellulaceae bacterium]